MSTVFKTELTKKLLVALTIVFLLGAPAVVPTADAGDVHGVGSTTTS